MEETKPNPPDINISKIGNRIHIYVKEPGTFVTSAYCLNKLLNDDKERYMYVKCKELADKIMKQNQQKYNEKKREEKIKKIKEIFNAPVVDGAVPKKNNLT